MFKEAHRSALWVMDRKKQLPDLEKRTVISPLHYGDTIEISFVRGIEGETLINGKRFVYQEKNVFFIPPKYLHTSVYRTGGGNDGDMVCAFHINVEALAPIVNLKNLLHKDNRTLFDLAFRCDDFDAIWNTVQEILDDDRTFITRILSLIRLFEMITEQKKNGEQAVECDQIATDLVDFVEKNYGRRLSLQCAASHFGYSEQYFCKWFKEKTGVTFHDFLNAVRINHACTFLSSGCSVEYTALQCGFSDASYFTKVFRRSIGITPTAYRLKSNETKKNERG